MPEFKISSVVLVFDLVSKAKEEVGVVLEGLVITASRCISKASAANYLLNVTVITLELAVQPEIALSAGMT